MTRLALQSVALVLCLLRLQAEEHRGTVTFAGLPLPGASVTATQDGVTVGAITGLGLVTASLALNYAFERRPLSLLLINGGYYVVQFVLYGVIFALI